MPYDDDHRGYFDDGYDDDDDFFWRGDDANGDNFQQHRFGYRHHQGPTHQGPSQGTGQERSHNRRPPGLERQGNSQGSGGSPQHHPSCRHYQEPSEQDQGQGSHSGGIQESRQQQQGYDGSARDGGRGAHIHYRNHNFSSKSQLQGYYDDDDEYDNWIVPSDRNGPTEARGGRSSADGSGGRQGGRQQGWDGRGQQIGRAQQQQRGGQQGEDGGYGDNRSGGGGGGPHSDWPFGGEGIGHDWPFGEERSAGDWPFGGGGPMNWCGGHNGYGYY